MLSLWIYITTRRESRGSGGFDATGKVIENKQIDGGKIANVNGSVQTNNIGPDKKNSFQPVSWQKDLKWYSLPRK